MSAHGRTRFSSALALRVGYDSHPGAPAGTELADDTVESIFEGLRAVALSLNVFATPPPALDRLQITIESPDVPIYGPFLGGAGARELLHMITPPGRKGLDSTHPSPMNFSQPLGVRVKPALPYGQANEPPLSLAYLAVAALSRLRRLGVRKDLVVSCQLTAAGVVRAVGGLVAEVTVVGAAGCAMLIASGNTITGPGGSCHVRPLTPGLISSRAGPLRDTLLALALETGGIGAGCEDPCGHDQECLR
jgi:hypothetical protein